MIKRTLIFMLCLFWSMSSMAQSSQLISIDKQNITLKQLITTLQSDYGFKFMYSNNDVDDQQKVTIKINNADIQAVLSQALTGSNITFEVKDQQVVLTQARELIKNKKIIGKISDADGVPMPMVNILLKGTTVGVLSQDDGSYSIEVPANVKNATLLYSFIGYTEQEELIGNRSLITVSLVSSVNKLDQVVVTALGIKRAEKALGYAVQNVKGNSLQTVKSIDVGTALTGKVAGLMVKNSTEFADAPVISIRGEEPLLVIDGVPYANMSLRDIPSDDIESISILKGATASALYGYRGGSGAIMVTSKKGSENKGLSVSVNSSTMFTAGYLAIPETQSTFGRIVRTATNTYDQSGNGSWGVPMEGQEVIQWDPISKSMQSMPYLPRGKDNFKNFLEQGLILNNNINVVQQGEFGSFRTSATWVNNKGTYPNSVFNKYTFSVGGDMKMKQFLLSSSMSYNKQKSPNVGFGGYRGYDPMYGLLIWSAPDFDVRDYKDYWVIDNEVQNTSYTGDNNNPYFDRYERLNTLDKDIFNGTIALNYDILPFLKATLRSGFDIYSTRKDIRIAMGSFTGAGVSTVIPNGTEVWGESKKGSFNTGLSRGYSFNTDFIVSAEKTINDFSFDGFLGSTIFYKQDDGMEARSQGGLSVPGFYSLKASINPVKTNSVIYKQQVNSLYGRLAVSWRKMIYVEGTLRNDWSSTLSQSTRSYLYPSVSSSFIVSEVLPKLDWLSLWKLRGSWTVSKKPADIYAINNVFSIDPNAWANMGSAEYPTTVRGSNVFPESASSYEVGTVLNFLKNRASLDVSYYEKKMYNFLKATEVSNASGYLKNYINVDESITRKGWEVTINGTPLKTGDWQLDLAFNWSKYAKYYTKLDPQFSADKPWIKKGERADHYIIRDYQKDPDGNVIHSSGLPIYSAYDSRVGYSDPDWLWGLNGSLKYKNWQFNCAVDGRVGGLTSTITEMYMWRAGSHPNSVVNERYLDATNAGTANYLGDGVKVVSGSAIYDTYGNIESDTRKYAPNDNKVTYKNYIEAQHKGTAWGGAASPLDVYSTTFFKIREMSLTYSLPEYISKKMYAKKVTVSAVGQNLMLWAKQFKYSDPDGGTDNFSDPSLRYLGFNIQMTF